MQGHLAWKVANAQRDSPSPLRMRRETARTAIQNTAGERLTNVYRSSSSLPIVIRQSSMDLDDSHMEAWACRRNNGRSVSIRKRNGQEIELDNRWVAPYNPFLSTLFDCHINVEVVSSIKAVKYLYKYVYKGHDMTQVRVERNESGSRQPEPAQGPVEADEIAEYLNAR